VRQARARRIRVFGGEPAAAYLHLARTVCRRAERLVVELADRPGEVVSAAKQGVIDGGDLPIINIDALRIYEVSKFCSMTFHNYGPTLIVMNLEMFENLSTEHKKLLLDLGREAQNRVRHATESVDNFESAKKLLEPKGMTGLAYWDNGFKQMTANKKLIAPSDYKGMKFRIQSSKVIEAQFRTLGAIPQVMAFSEVYQALQTGVVDGQENTWSNIYTQKMHEVQKYITVTNHGYIGYIVVANKKFWEGLPAEIRGQLEKALQDATVYGNDISEKENAEALEAIKKSGKSTIFVSTPTETEAMRKVMEPIYAEMAKRIGKATIDEFQKETMGVTQ